MNTTSHRLAGLDVGDRRIGVAISDPLGLTAQPLGVVQRVSVAADIHCISQMLTDYEIGGFVLGLPLQMDAAEGEQVGRVRRFGKRLGAETRVPVTYFDERLTSVQSERLLTESGMTRKRRRQVIDKLAATLILQAYLDAAGSTGSGE